MNAGVGTLRYVWNIRTIPWALFVAWIAVLVVGGLFAFAAMTGDHNYTGSRVEGSFESNTRIDIKTLGGTPVLISAISTKPFYLTTDDQTLVSEPALKELVLPSEERYLGKWQLNSPTTVVTKGDSDVYLRLIGVSEAIQVVRHSSSEDMTTAIVMLALWGVILLIVGFFVLGWIATKLRP